MTRRAFSLLDCVAALGLLAVAMTLVVQVSLWSLGEHRQGLARQEALEEAANLLEAARTLLWEELTPQWAARQRLPEGLAERLGHGRLTVRVEPVPARPHTRRVNVTIAWDRQSLPGQEVQLTGLFSARAAAVSGGKP
jgi:hypothetical protein